MNKGLRLLLLLAALAAALSLGALAADTAAAPAAGGIYDLSGSGVTLTPDAAKTTETVDGQAQDYYPNARKVTVTATGRTPGAQYLLLVLTEQALPTAQNIAYIDQTAADADGSLTLTAYPAALTAGQYFVYLVGDGSAFDAKAPAAAFRYDAKYTLGDVDGTNGINTNDAVWVLKHCVGLEVLKPGSTAYLAADVDRNNTINTNDAVLILKYIVGLIQGF